MDLQQLGNEATSAVQNQYPSLQILRDALVKKFSTNNPLIQQRQTALTNFLASPEEANLKYGSPQNVTIGGGQVPAPGQNPVGEQTTVPNVYLSPLQQRSLYSRHVANKFAPLSTLNDLLQLQSGGIEQVLSQANRGMESDIKAKQQKFDVAKSLEELRLKSRGLDISASRVGATSQKAADKQNAIMKQFDNALTKIRLAKNLASQGGSGLSGMDLFGIRHSAPAMLGGLGKKTYKLASALGQANTAWFETAGKALTQSEREVVEMPNIRMRQDFLIQRLNDWENDILRLKGNIASGTYDLGDMNSTVAEDDFTPDL